MWLLPQPHVDVLGLAAPSRCCRCRMPGKLDEFLQNLGECLYIQRTATELLEELEAAVEGHEGVADVLLGVLDLLAVDGGGGGVGAARSPAPPTP